MKTEIHPKYVECKATCACGASFATRSTKEAISIETCSQCHPFYTGKEKLMDTAGRVERFRRKYAGVKKKDKKSSVAEVLAEQTEKKDKQRVLIGQSSGKKEQKKPEVKKGESKQQAKPETKPAPKAEAEIVAKPESKPETKPAPKAEAEIAAKPESKPEKKLAEKAEAKTEEKKSEQ